MFEEAFKQQPSNEELGAQTFFANVRAGHWKSAQQVRVLTRELTLALAFLDRHTYAQAIPRGPILVLECH